MIGRTASCFCSILLFASVLVLPASRSSAQAAFVDGKGGMDVRMFRPAVDSKGFISVNGTSVLGDRDYSFGLVLDMGLGIFPIRTFSYDAASTPQDADRNTRLIGAAVTGTLHFNYGLGNAWVFGLQVPVQIVNGPNAIIPGTFNDSAAPSGIDSQGFGNITLHGKLRILRSEREPVGLAAVLHVELPTGDAAQFRGEPGVALWPMLATDWVPVPAFRLGLNLGYRWNSSRGPIMPFRGRIDPVTNPASAARALLNPSLCNSSSSGELTSAICPGETRGGTPIRYDDLLTAGLGVSLRFAKAAELVGEVYGTQLVKAIGDKGGLGAEAIGGLKIYVERNSYLLLAGGAGILRGINSADVRAVRGFLFERGEVMVEDL